MQVPFKEGALSIELRFLEPLFLTIPRLPFSLFGLFLKICVVKHGTRDIGLSYKVAWLKLFYLDFNL
jgi:hypothetical protein